MAEEKTTQEKMEEKLLDEACKAYGVAKKYVFASAVRDSEVTIVTNGGKKVRWKKGDEVEPLDEIAVTGINPKAEKRKVIIGKGAGKKKG